MLSSLSQSYTSLIHSKDTLWVQLFDSSCVAVVVNKAVKIFYGFLSWPLFPLLLIYPHIYPIYPVLLETEKKMEFKWTTWNQALLTLSPKLFKGCSLTNPQHQDYLGYHGRCKALGLVNQETVTDFISLGSKITADGDMKLKDACSLEEKLWQN